MFLTPPPPARPPTCPMRLQVRCWIKANTLPAGYQASLAGDKGKGSVNGGKDAGVAEITAILSALSVGVKEAAEGGGVQDSEMCEVLSHLGIVPGMPTTPPAMEAVESWVELKDQEEVVKALAADAEAVLVEKMNDKLSEEPDSDEEEELNDTGEIENAGGRKLVAPPPYTELSGVFGPLEQLAQLAGNTEAGHFLRKMSFLAAHAAKPVPQADMRMFLES